MCEILFKTDWTLRIMIKKNVKYFCRDFTKIENYEEAVKDNTQIWDCHHKREIEENKSMQQLKQEGLYYDRPPEEFIFLTTLEHKKLHALNMTVEHKKRLSDAQKGKHLSEETRRKMSEVQKGEKHPMYGKHHTAETKRKMSESQSGVKNHNFGKHHSEQIKEKIRMSVQKYWNSKKQ